MLIGKKVTTPTPPTTHSSARRNNNRRNKKTQSRSPTKNNSQSSRNKSKQARGAPWLKTKPKKPAKKAVQNAEPQEATSVITIKGKPLRLRGRKFTV